MRTSGSKGNRIFLPAAAFGLAALLLCAVFACFGLFPFGGKTLSWCDMNQQVVPLMLEFKDILAGKTGFLLNLQNAGGMSFWGVFFFFLSSPFTFLIAFVEKGSVYFLVNVLVLWKLALSASSASLFFREEQPGLETGAHLFLSVSYGLCGYGLLYYQNLVWLDVLCLFPILMIGFRRAVFQGKGCLFALSLAALTALNYYLSYMVYLALILMAALFLKNCVPKGERGAAAGRIGAGAASALLLTGVIWLPSLLQCLRSARTAQGLAETIRQGGFFTETGTALPVLLCTGAAAALPVLAVIFPLTGKRRALIQLFFLFSLPLVIEPVNKLWHTGSYQAFPARYGYIPLFTALWYVGDLLGDRALWLDASRRKKHPVLLALVFLLPVVPGALLIGLDFSEITSYTSTLWFDDKSFGALLLVSLLAAGAVLLYIWSCKKGGLTRRALGWVLFALCLLQGGFHAAVLVGSAANVPERGEKVLALEGTLEDGGLYRVKMDRKVCNVNLLGALGYPTLNHYTSLTDEKFLHAVKKLGYSSYWMETSACCGTGVSDILLSNKYALTDALTWRETGGGNLGYVLPSGALPENMPDGDRFAQQSDIYFRIMSTKSGVFQDPFTRYSPTGQSGVKISGGEGGTEIELTGEQGVLQYEVRVTDRETLYFDAFCENTNRLREAVNGSFQVKVNGRTLSESYPSQSYNGIMELGRFQNETVRVEVLVKKPVDGLRSFGVAGLRDDKLKALTEELPNAQLSAQGSRIFGTAWAEGPDRSLFLSIPYAPGMKAAVNGQAAELKIVLDCFLEIPLEQGENRIELTYLPQGVGLGALFSSLGLGAWGAWIVLRRSKLGKRAAAAWNRAALPLLYAAFFAVLLLVYLLPPVVWMGRG